MEKVQQQEKERKPYIAPQIVHEIELETRAGTGPRSNPQVDLYNVLRDPLDLDR